MLSYISAEEFLNQPKEVQEKLSKYFFNGVDEFDLFVETGIYALNKEHRWFSKPIFRYQFNTIMDGRYIPLFTETQLRKFIEEKSGKIDCIGITNKDYSISTFIKSYGIDYAEDLLQAYWLVACKIAEDI